MGFSVANANDFESRAADGGYIKPIMMCFLYAGEHSLYMKLLKIRTMDYPG